MQQNCNYWKSVSRYYHTNTCNHIFSATDSGQHNILPINVDKCVWTQLYCLYYYYPEKINKCWHSGSRVARGRSIEHLNIIQNKMRCWKRKKLHLNCLIDIMHRLNMCFHYISALEHQIISIFIIMWLKWSAAWKPRYKGSLTCFS